MPSDPPSKDHYSYEDMMARLRESRPQSSKVKSEERTYDPATGKTTVRKSKKRRATSSESISMLKDPLWFRRVRIAVFVAVPLLSVLCVACYFVLIGAASSGRFQEGLGASLARQFGAAKPLDVQNTSLGGLNLSIGQADFVGTPEQPVASASAKEIELRLSPDSFLGGDWTARYCIVRHGTLVLRAAQAAATAGVGTSAPPLLGAGFLLSDDPQAIHFSELSIWNASVLFGDNDPVKAPGLRNVRVAFSRRNTPGTPLHLDGQMSGGREGLLSLPGWVPLKVETIRLAIHPGKAAIARAIFHLGDDEMNQIKSGVSSHIEVKGDLPLEAGTPADLQMHLRGIILRELLPKAVTRYCDGVLRADSLHLSYLPENPLGTWKLAGPAAIDLGQLRALGLINHLQDLTNGEITGISVDECVFDLDVSHQGLRLENIKAATMGKIHLEGSLGVDADGRLSGKLRLGLPREVLLQKIPPFFTGGGEDGIYWADVTLGGTLASPLEDLSPRLQSWSAGTGEALPAGLKEPEPDARAPEPAGEPRPAGRNAEEWEELFDSLTNGAQPESPDGGRPTPRQP